MFHPDTSPDAAAVHIARLRQMTPSQRLQVAMQAGMQPTFGRKDTADR